MWSSVRRFSRFARLSQARRRPPERAGQELAGETTGTVESILEGIEEDSVLRRVLPADKLARLSINGVSKTMILRNTPEEKLARANNQPLNFHASFEVIELRRALLGFEMGKHKEEDHPVLVAYVQIAYMAIPRPRPLELSSHLLSSLLHMYFLLDKKNPEYARAYLSLLDEMRACNLPITYREHLVRIAYVASTDTRIYSRSSDAGRARLSYAIDCFRQMETDGYREKTPRAFNLLLASANLVADLRVFSALLREMRARGIPPDRYTYYSLITRFGRRGNKKAVQVLYEKMTQAQEVVDIVALETVINALVRCGDVRAAESMIKLIEARALQHGWTASELSNREQRRLNLIYAGIAANRRRLLQTHGRIYAEPDLTVQIVPRASTYDSILAYYARAGDLVALYKIFDRLRLFDCVRTRAYYIVLVAFCHHGLANPQSTEWNLENLQFLVDDMLAHADSVSPDVVVAALKAAATVGASASQIKDWKLQLSDGLDDPDHKVDIAYAKIVRSLKSSSRRAYYNVNFGVLALDADIEQRHE